MRIDPQIKEELKTYLENKLKNKQKPHVLIRAPYQFSEDEIEKLKKRIAILEKAELTFQIDPKILAGFVIHFNSSVIDLTINSELQSLSHTLYETA